MKCYAYKADGTICGAVANYLCPTRGIAVCEMHVLPADRNKSAKELARNLEEWQRGLDHFTAKLFSLMAKADIRNMERLRKGFPNEVQAYQAWKRYGEAFLEDPEKFIFKGTMKEFFDGTAKLAEAADTVVSLKRKKP